MQAFVPPPASSARKGESAMNSAAARVITTEQRPDAAAPTQPLATPDPALNEPASFDARRQREHLEDSLKSWADDAAADEAPNAGDWRTFGASSKAIKTALAIAVAVAFGYSPVQRLLATTSVEAVVDARVVTIRAPIDGDVAQMRGGLDVGAELAAGDALLTIVNPRAEQGERNALRRAKALAQANIAALIEKRAALETNRIELARLQEQFRVGRVEQLKNRIAELDAQIAAAAAQQRYATQMANRARALKATGFVSAAGLDKAHSDEQGAIEATHALQQRRASAMVELDAAALGAFIGDANNDMPHSAQRALDIGVQMAEIDARLVAAKAELADVGANLEQEATRFDQIAAAPIVANMRGRVWETLVTPGEHVAKGQELLRLLDCSGAMVSASVTENAYEHLRIGQKATFKPRDGGRDLDGWIVGLNGASSVSGNAAIGFGALTRAPFHASVKFPDLASESECHIGRTGLVTFSSEMAPRR
jgi:multidrug resistance efflux pump